MIEPHLYRAAALFVDPKDQRPALSYIRVENHPKRGGVLLVATNGHTLIAAHDPLASPVARPLLIPADLKPAANAFGIELHPDGRTNVTGGPTFAPVTETGFPERWRDAVRTPASRAPLPRALGAEGIACCTPPTERDAFTFKLTEYATAAVMPYDLDSTPAASGAVWDATP